MGAVHGVILKYVGLSVAAGLAHVSLEKNSFLSYVMFYVAVLNLFVTVGFMCNRGTEVLGKNAKTGQLPLWSYVLWAGFIGPTWLYTAVHTFLGKKKGVREADEIFPQWWLGSRYADLVRERPERFAGIVDLTCELPERLMADCDDYKLVPCWDGTPPSIADIDAAADFCGKKSHHGHILVHCAHGRGRSTCVFVAALVKAGKFDNWQDAFAAVKLRRSACKLNAKMRTALQAWQDRYIRK